MKYEVVITLGYWWTFDTREEAEEALKEASKFPGQVNPYIRKVKLS